MGRRKKDELEDIVLPENTPETTKTLELEDLEGVGKTRAERMRADGIESPFDVYLRGVQEIKSITGMEEAQALKIYDSAREFLLANKLIKPSMCKASELLAYTKERFYVSTGVKAIDEALGGGVESEAITEIYGEFSAGKTQFALTCLVNACALGHGCVFVDCEGTFDHGRVKEIATARGFDAEHILDNVTMANGFDTITIDRIINSIPKLIREENVKFVVIDGATGKYRSEFLGRGTLEGRQQDIKHILLHLGKIAEVYNIIILFTNQVLADPGQMFGDPTKAIGGHSVAHNTKFRLYFKKASTTKPLRVCKIVDSAKHAMQDIPFQLGAKGVEDTE